MVLAAGTGENDRNEQAKSTNTYVSVCQEEILSSKHVRGGQNEVLFAVEIGDVIPIP